MSKSTLSKIHGVPGERARAAGVIRAVGPLLAALFACGVFTGLILPRTTLTAAGSGFLIAAGCLIWAVRDGLRGINAFFKGARGEERVAAVLANLPDGFHVFHDLACGGTLTGIDHVVVGPDGIFVVETKAWADRVTLAQDRLLVGGRPPSRSPIAQARHAVERVKRFLAAKTGVEPPCTAVVCFADNTFAPSVASLDGCTICNLCELPRLLSQQGDRLSEDEVERVVRILEQKAL